MSDILRQINKGNFTRLSLARLGMILLSVAALQWGTSRPNDHVLHSVSDQRQTPAASRPATIVRPVSCERLPNVPGKSITTVVVEFPPNAFSPRHRHPGSVTAFVLKGKVRSQLDNGPAETFAVGQSWFEPPGTIHMFAENASATEPASLLATFVADDDCGPLTIFD
jgi:quercetin dioxygenase-like cupin family protein